MILQTLVILLCLLAFTTSATAENAWVLWEESGDLQTFQHAGTPHAQSTYARVEDCVKAIDAAWQAVLLTTEEPDRHGFNRLTPRSAIIMMTYGSTNTTYVITYTCLPDTSHPPGPNGTP